MTQLVHAADTTTHREIYFIDDGLTDVDTLLAALPDGAPWYLIDRDEDGVQQMAEVLAEHAGLMAVHVLAHGTPGKMQLGSASIDRAALLRQVCLWEEISAALDPDGDLLFYACELAGGRRGTDFIDTVYQLTGVNIAASRSLVGAAALGGNWDLDARVGSVKSRPLDIQSYTGVFASPTVVEPITLDSGFDQPLDAADPGTVNTALDGFDSAANAVTIDSAGKVLVAGWRYVGDPLAPTSAFYVARYNADGSLDTTFSGDGMATASFGGVEAAANAVGIDSLDRIVAVGKAGDAFAIARFNADGTADTSFGGGDGELTGAFGTAVFSIASGVAFVGTDIVIAGTADGDFGIARISENGTLSQSVTTDIAGGSTDSVAAIAVLADNTILVAGSADAGLDSNFVLANYNVADLSATTGLGGTGIANVDFAGGVDVASAMAIDANGQAVVVGTRFSGASKDFVVARYNTDGSLDTSFGGSGWVVTDFAAGDDEAFAVVIQADGKIVVSGRTLIGGQYDTVFARYNPDGTLDTEFDGDGRLTLAVDVGVGAVAVDDSVAAMAIADNGEIIAVGSAINGDSAQTGVVLINLAPVVPTLAAVAEDTVAPAGASVSSLVAANFSDPDGGDSLGGVAIAGDASNAGQGVWEYSSDNGLTWFAVGPVDATNALLVAASDLLRFVPAADFNGAPGGLTLHLVDSLSGVSFSAGATRQMLLDGSATLGVSAETITLSTSVGAVADAPTLTAASLAAIVEGTASPAGESVAALFGANFADVDAGDTFAGIAISGDASTAAQGVWEYSVDGVVWSMVGPVSAGAALLLDTSAQLRFVPTTDFQGVPGALAVHAVDSSAALAFTTDPGFPETFDTTSDLETSGVAVASVDLSVTVTNISDAPTILYSMTPDTAFGNGGLVTAEFGAAIDELAVGVAIQSGGQVVVAGSTFDGLTTQFAVARYDADGNLKATFGTGGKVTTAFAEGDATAEAVAVAPLSNKILVAGSVTDGFQSDFAIARYNATTGALDATFGGDGMVTTAIGAGEDVATSLSIDGGGQIVLAGYTFNGSDNDIAVARYKLDGSLDTSFSGDGMATLDFGGAFDEANAVQALGDGKVIVAGSSDGVFAVARFNEDGTLDTTFDVDGALTTDVGGFGFSIATTILEQADGKILVGGYASGADFTLDFALVRYNADGSLDLSFGDGGVVLTDFGQGDDFGASVLIDADGKIVLSGSAADGFGGQDMAFARYNSDGSLDTSFGTGGLLQLAIGSGAAAAIASTLTPSGDLLAVGTAANADTTTDFAVVQLTTATSVALASIDEDSPLVVGDSVLNLFGNSFHDADGDTFAGVAVSANTATVDQGVWEYSTDAGTNWFAVGGVSAGAALLLAGDSLLRFLPASGYHGTPGGLQVHLVDSSTTAAFTNGALTQVFNTAAAGGGTAVSAASVGLATSVLPTNDAPTGSNATFTVVEDTARILTAVDFGFADIDVGDTLAAVEITDISVPGTLTLDGNQVFPFDTILRADIDAGLLVFQPLANGNGAAYAAISFLVNDGTDAALAVNALTFDVTAVRDDLFLTGTAGRDILIGDQIDAGSFDTLDGGAGDDGLRGMAGDDLLFGRAGNDYLAGGRGADTMDGGAGNDQYWVDDAGDVVIETNAGVLAGGVDTVSATVSYALGANIENLRIVAAGDGTGNALNNVLYAGSGDNVLNGGAGTDTASYEYAGAGVSVSLAAVGAQATGGSGSDTLLNVEKLIGSRFNDHLVGNAATNGLVGGAGDDILSGGGGADFLAGGLGVDTMDGGDGSDHYWVDNAADVVIESNANKASGGIDTVIARVSYTLGANIENLRIVAAGDGTGNALNNMLYGGSGDNVLNGGVGTDTVSYEYASAGVSVSLAAVGAQATGGSGSDTLLNVEKLIGSNFGDSLTGDGAANSLNGAVGNDVLDGGAGDDLLFGGTGADTMRGGDGNDQYWVGSAGDVVIESNADKVSGGIDTVIARVSHTLGANVENLQLIGAVNGTGNGLNNVLFAGSGDNVLDGGAGSDTVSYGYASSAVTVSLAAVGAQATGGSGNDTLLNVERLYGSAFGDVLTGNAGANRLGGGGGNDTLDGGAGNDILTGGRGDDVFVFSSAGFGNDRVIDFDADPVAGQDLLDISGLGVSAATFAGAVTIQDLGTDVLLSFAGGDSIRLAGIDDATTITASDFILAA